MAQAGEQLKVSELDFENIKGALKRFLANQNEFKDYDFEGSSMAILLDLLAYNTHYLGYNANMLANEMFLDSADLRSSVVSKAKQVGYDPQVILSGRRINDHMPIFVAKKAVQLMIKADKDPNESNVLVLGITFKENVSDIRNSKVADLVKELKEFSEEYTPSWGVIFSAPDGNEIGIPFKHKPSEAAHSPGFVTKRIDYDHWLFKKLDNRTATILQGEEVKDIALLGQGNDKTSADIQTNEQAQELIKGDDSGMSGANIAKGLKAANQLMGALEPKQGEAFEDTFKLEKAENVMTPVQSQQFGNAFQGAQFEDGGVSPISEMARMRQPTYECGGIHSGTKQAEDGDLMFDSEGEGAVVGGDSFERDRVDARLNSGEAVLNVAQQQRLMDILRGEESVDSLGEDDIVEGVPSGYQEELTEEIDNGEDMKVSGLKKLLSALGE